MQTEGSSKKLIIAGWVLSAIPALMLLSGAVNAWRQAPFVVQGTTHLGYPVSLVVTLGTIEAVCAILYLIPRTAFYGALLLTAYMGGAVASHLRIGEPQWFVPIIFGIIVWTALGLRDFLLRAFLL